MRRRRPSSVKLSASLRDQFPAPSVNKILGKDGVLGEMKQTERQGQGLMSLWFQLCSIGNGLRR